MLKHKNQFKASLVKTPLGLMLAISDEKSLFILEFVEEQDLECKFERLRKKMNCSIVLGNTKPLEKIEQELNQYFSGKLKRFNTTFELSGSLFQKIVWNSLMKVPFGKTRSYKEMAESIKHPTAFRAVANANGANPLSIIIPCHRVINTNGDLGGYAAGVSRKEWLLKHEQKFM